MTVIRLSLAQVLVWICPNAEPEPRTWVQSLRGDSREQEGGSGERVAGKGKGKHKAESEVRAIGRQ